MRKDVKLGFAIGGVLLAVAIVFALVNTARPPKTSEETADTGTTTSQPEAVATESNKPAAPVTPETPAKPDSVAAAKPDAAAKPEPAKNDAVAEGTDVFKNNGGTNWDESFKTGMPVMAASNTSVALPPTGDRPQGDPATPAKPAIVSTGATGFNYGTRTAQPDADEAIKAAGNTANQPVTIVATTARPASTHTIKSGETFSTIAAAYYGNAKYHKLISAANPKVDSSHLKIGQVITLPAFDGKAEAAKSASAATSAPEKAVDAKKEYRVQAGDNLHRICMKLYGNPKNVDAIYALNKAAIGSDPAKLKLGMVLNLPAAPTVASTSR